MLNESALANFLENNARDRLTSSAKAILAAVPFAGPVLAELAGVAIPDQPLDRVARFAAELDRRLAGVEEEIIKGRWSDNDFLELSEVICDCSLPTMQPAMMSLF